MERRIAFLDIDGTIVDHDGRIPDSTSAAIRGARANGHLVLLATGRSPLEIDARLDDLGFDGVIASAGAFVRFGDEWIIEHLMPQHDVEYLVSTFSALGLEYVLQGRDAVYPTPGMLERIRLLIDQGVYDDGPSDDGATPDRGMRRYLGDFDEPRYDRIAKAVFFGDRPSAYDAVLEAVGRSFHVVTGTIPLMGTASGEVSRPDVTKGSAIVELLDRLGMPLSASIAVGDNNNDLEMLRTAGIGVAMGNGTDQAKAAADEVTAPIDENGLSAAFARHGLI